MDSCILGATGLRVTPIGLGLAALGRPAYITLGRDRDLGGDRSIDAMERRCHDVLDAGYQAGIRYVDAARSYGRSEQFLASWLSARKLPPGALAVGSKWGYEYVGEWRLDAGVHERKHHSHDALKRQLPETRALLGPWLGLYQIHSATIESGVLADSRVLAELVRLSLGGLAIGLTVSGPRQADTIGRALEANADGINPFACVQATWNLLETSAAPALAEAKAAGWGVIVKEALANGRLTDAHAGQDLRPLVECAASAGASLDAFAIASARAQPWCDVVLSGAVTPDQLRGHVSSLSVPVDAGELPRFAEPPETYWQRRSALPWR